MTVSTVLDKITYQGDGSNTAWTFGFAVSSPFDIQVFVTDVVGHVGQVPSNQFTVSTNAPIAPNPTAIGGVVNFPLTGPPITVGQTITLVRVVPETQPTSISNQSIVYPPVVEQGFDRLVMIDQQLSEQIGRAVSAPITDGPMAPLPSAKLRANMVAVFDANGNMTASTTLIGAPVSAAMIPVITATSLSDARSAMGVAPIVNPVFIGDPQAPTPAPTDNDTSIATTAYVQTALVGAAASFSTGDIKLTHKTAADPGWTLWSDGSIGNVGSGATNRAAPDCQALFTLYYNNYSDANCPVQTSAGATVTRASQGTAASAWANLCRVSLPRAVSRSLSIAGASGVGLTPRSLGSIAGAEGVNMTIGMMPAHTHPIATTGPHSHGAQWNVSGGGPPVGIADSGPPNWDATPASPTTPLASDNLVILPADIGIIMSSIGGGTPTPTITPSTYLNAMIKL